MLATPPSRWFTAPTLIIRRFELIVWVGGIGAAAAWCVASLWFPFGWDQGVHALAGHAIVQGGLPYRDVWEIKGPLVYFVWAAAEWLMGSTTVAIRVVDVTFQAAGAIALGCLVARWTSAAIGRWTGLTLFIAQTSLGWFNVSQSEAWVATILTLAFVPLLFERLEGRSRAGWLAWAGLLLGAAASVKPLFACLGVVPFVCCRRIRWSEIGLLAVSAAIVPLAFIALFAWRGALGSLIECYVEYNLFSYSRPQDFRLLPVIEHVGGYFFIGRNALRSDLPNWWMAMPVVAWGVITLWWRSRRIALTMLLWLGVSVAIVAIQDRFYIYHWVPTFPPLIALAGVGVSHLVAMGNQRSPALKASNVMMAAVPLAMSAAFLSITALSPARDLVYWVERITKGTTEEQFLRRFSRFDYVAWDAVTAARYIRGETAESDSVAVLGPAAAVNSLAGRGNPSRFVYALPLNSADRRFRSAYREEYMRAIRSRPPTFLVTQSRTADPLLRDFEELRDFVAVQYQSDRRFGNFLLFRRRTSAAALENSPH